MCDVEGFIGWVTLLFGLLAPGVRLVVSKMVCKHFNIGQVRGHLEPEGFCVKRKCRLWILGYKLSIELVFG